MASKFNNDLFVTSALKQRLMLEVEAYSGDLLAPWWCCVQKTNGVMADFSCGYAAEWAEKTVAHDIVKKLNKTLHHDGTWLAQWIGGGRQLNLLWIDSDGDVQFTVEVEEDAPGIANEPLLKWLEDCDEAWQMWYQQMRTVLAPSQDQLFKKAQGQPDPSAKSGVIKLPDDKDPDINIVL